jgi:hypothetical protein
MWEIFRTATIIGNIIFALVMATTFIGLLIAVVMAAFRR